MNWELYYLCSVDERKHEKAFYALKKNGMRLLHLFFSRYHLDTIYFTIIYTYTCIGQKTNIYILYIYSYTCTCTHMCTVYIVLADYTVCIHTNTETEIICICSVCVCVCVQTVIRLCQIFQFSNFQKVGFGNHLLNKYHCCLKIILF